MVLISLYTKFNNVGGAQKMCISIHKGLKKTMSFEEDYISSNTDFENLDKNYSKQIIVNNYLKFNVFELLNRFENALFISHHRKLTTQLVFWSKILRKRTKIIHVAHNEFYSLKWLTLFPNYVIAVSEGVKKNHESVFGLKEVAVIYNGIDSNYIDTQKERYNPKSIKILIAGRITKVKQQVKLAIFLKSRLPENIKLIFAGTGDDYNELVKITKNNPQFESLGHVSDMKSLIASVDYVMLFSQKEGLPLSLIEGLSCGLPILCNDVGGNLEILQKGYNGFLINDLGSILKQLERISKLSTITYNELSQNSRKSFVQNFNFDKMVSNYRNYILTNVKD
jgi:glycosyltransferase involved in cell wall biosynthesis